MSCSACFLPNLMGSDHVTRGIRHVMSPMSMAHVPNTGTLPDTVPTVLPVPDKRLISLIAFTVLGFSTILHWQFSLDWSYDTATVNDLYQFTGTHTCRHTSFSLTHLAQFAAFLSLTTHYGIHFVTAAACTNAFTMAIITITLVQVPTSVLPSLPGKNVPPAQGMRNWRRIPADQQTNR